MRMTFKNRRKRHYLDSERSSYNIIFYMVFIKLFSEKNLCVQIYLNLFSFLPSCAKLRRSLDPDPNQGTNPNWGLDPDPSTMYLDPQHWSHVDPVCVQVQLAQLQKVEENLKKEVQREYSSCIIYYSHVASCYSTHVVSQRVIFYCNAQVLLCLLTYDFYRFDDNYILQNLGEIYKYNIFLNFVN